MFFCYIFMISNSAINKNIGGGRVVDLLACGA